MAVVRRSGRRGSYAGRGSALLGETAGRPRASGAAEQRDDRPAPQSRRAVVGDGSGHRRDLSSARGRVTKSAMARAGFSSPTREAAMQHSSQEPKSKGGTADMERSTKSA
ncbi:hypothetical protein E2562_005753 [Oryza meyeriana var. granulata]|uniref:Uncharacterized protein n=1 Tax=Oryza meyeriana var. granulata TaxID=110450 RepID=A0A6G1F4H4_9ORYZ|nr:hypothetical protein E2562_005753 [Oryza meyeriana var. granulata]